MSDLLHEMMMIIMIIIITIHGICIALFQDPKCGARNIYVTAYNQLAKQRQRSKIPT